MVPALHLLRAPAQNLQPAVLRVPQSLARLTSNRSVDVPSHDGGANRGDDPAPPIGVVRSDRSATVIRQPSTSSEPGGAPAHGGLLAGVTPTQRSSAWYLE